MSAPPKQRYTVDEYFAIERSSDVRHEFIDGEIYAMSGGSSAHSQISQNTASSLHYQLRDQPCIVYNSDMRVKINNRDYTYPDIPVVCGEPQVENEKHTLLNPTLIVEVLSPSTANYDRGEKFDRYRTLESLQEYVLIAQDEARVERFLRQNNGKGEWLYAAAVGLEATLTLPSIGCTLALTDVYAKVDFEGE